MKNKRIKDLIRPYTPVSTRPIKRRVPGISRRRPIGMVGRTKNPFYVGQKAIWYPADCEDIFSEVNRKELLKVVGVTETHITGKLYESSSDTLVTVDFTNCEAHHDTPFDTRSEFEKFYDDYEI